MRCKLNVSAKRLCSGVRDESTHEEHESHDVGPHGPQTQSPWSQWLGRQLLVAEAAHNQVGPQELRVRGACR